MQRKARTALLLAASLLLATGAIAGKEGKRPRITGIAGVTVHVTSVDTAKAFYGKFLEKDVRCTWCDEGFPHGKSRSKPTQASSTSLFFAFNHQFVKLDESGPWNSFDFVEEVMFFTDDLRSLLRYLRSKNLTVGIVPESWEAKSTLVEVFTVDPAGHRISFRKLPSQPFRRQTGAPVMRIVHAGFVVRDQAAMDRFYRDILGFRPYWHGGMKDDQTDWVSLQVSDGTDWVEFMVNVPENADERLRGIMNHVALGVPDIESAAYRIHKNGIDAGEEPKLGRDGKWQLNLYDPDRTRIEFMEFTPKEKPCCSEFTGPHPKP